MYLSRWPVSKLFPFIVVSRPYLWCKRASDLIIHTSQSSTEYVAANIQLKPMRRDIASLLFHTMFSVCGVKFDSCDFHTLRTDCSLARDKGSVRSASHFCWTEGTVLQGIHYEVLTVAAVQETREEEALGFQANRFSRSRQFFAPDSSAR